MRKAGLWCLILILCWAFLFPAQGENSYPASQGKVTDLAGVISPQCAQDLAELSQRLEKAASGSLYVVTRHFLGGKSTQDYADGLFEAWKLGQGDGLLLLVIGEDAFALSLGKEAAQRLPGEMRTALLGQFRSVYLSRAYDQAVTQLTLSLAQSLAKAAGKSLNTAGLFGKEEIQSTPAPLDLGAVFQDMFGTSYKEDQPVKDHQDEESDTNWRSVIIWGLVIYFLFFRKKKRKRFNFGHAPKKRGR